MGDNVWNINGSRFRLPPAKIGPACDALREMAKKLELDEPEVDDGETVGIEACLSLFDCECSFAEDGSVSDVFLSTERPDYYDDENGESDSAEGWALKAIAPFVDHGSYVGFESTGDAWAYVFHDGVVESVNYMPDHPAAREPLRSA